jgi:hypothetical protein
MNTRTSLIAIGATLALVAPAAANARAIVNEKGDIYVASKHSSHALVGATNFVSENGSRIQVNSSATNFVSENGNMGTRSKTQGHRIGKANTAVKTSGAKPGVTYIYVAGRGAVAASAYVDPSECQDNGTSCTDQEACTYWGQNCNIIAAVPQNASPTNKSAH